MATKHGKRAPKLATDTAWVLIAVGNAICYGTYASRREVLAHAVGGGRIGRYELTADERAHWRRLKAAGYRTARVRINEVRIKQPKPQP